MTRGIDVSSYQGKIDWERVRPHIDFAIIRCGWGNDSRRQDDVYFERNARICRELGIPFGVYLYSYATSLDDARSEVEHTLRLIKDKKLEYPVFLDVEARRMMALPRAELTEIVKYYCDEMERNGYYVGIYASLDRFNSNLDSRELDAFDKWVAEWNDRLTFRGRAGMWQHTAYEEMPGIRTRVDGDIAYIDYPEVIRRAGLNHLDEENLKFSRGDKVFITGDVYKDSDGREVLENICDKEYVIEEVLRDREAPYKIEIGYVKSDSAYKKCE